MEATMKELCRPLTARDEELQAEDPERLAYEKRIEALRGEEYPMLKGV